MRKLLFSVLAVGSLVVTGTAREHRLDWWQEARFGMFIHFGVYAIPARGEWVKCRERMDDAKYDTYVRDFNPDLFDAREWARTAKRAGMKYVVLTTKHHDGFCLFDSKLTDYKITRTPFGRDLVREYVDACRAEGLRVGFYYSLLDWHHADYTIDERHPQRPFCTAEDWTDENRAEFNRLNATRDMQKYREYMFVQVRELLTNYGKIDVIWLDFSFPKGEFGKSRSDWHSEELIGLVRSLQPDILVNNRLDLADDPNGWDFLTPEQMKVRAWPTVGGRRAPWETCQTFSGSWGYNRDETSWKNPHQLIELLVHSVARGGNLIMNVGPTARGVFDERALARLDVYAKWMRFNSASIYGCTQAPDDFKAPEGCELTYNQRTRRLYIHLVNYPTRHLFFSFPDRVAKASFLHDGSELKCRKFDYASHANELGDITDKEAAEGVIDLPILTPNVEIPVIEVCLK